MKYLRAILRILKRLFRSMGRVLKQLFGMIIFVALAVVETSDWSGIMARYNDPAKEAFTYGMSVPEATTHLMISMGLSIAIILAALITALGFMRDENWILKASQATGVLFALYGVYQVFSGLSLININQEGVILAGVIYFVIGLAVYGLGAKFTSPPKPLPRQTSK